MNDLTTVRFRNPSKNIVVFTAKQKVYKWLNKRVARKADHILTYTQFVKDDIVDFAKINPAKITVTHLAADPITEKSRGIQSLHGDDFILYVGRPLPHKNLGRLIDAFALLKESHPQLKLVLAGKKDVLYEKIETNAHARHLNDVYVTGFVSEGQLKWLYENCRAYVFPSLSEGFGLPALEAMMHGAPVVSSNATCLPEVSGEAAHYFDPLDSSDIAAKIAEVLDDPQLRKRLVQSGNKQVQKFAWDQTAAKTLAVYDKLLNI